MATFAVDIDDTLYSFGDLAREVVADVGAKTYDENLIRAAYTPWGEWRIPPDVMGLDTWLEIIELCHTDEMILAQIPYKGAYDGLWNIINSGHDIVYISNRREDSHGATANWLELHGFPYATGYDESGDSLIGRASLVCTTGNKHPFISHCQYLIDDRPKTLVEFVYDYDWKNKHGSDTNHRKGFGLYKEFNSSLTDVPGVYLAPTWVLLEKHMAKKGILREPVLK
jgi:hypothetical protein